MRVILNYNFNPNDIADSNFAALYETRRRDAVFAFVYEQDGTTYAMRDHLAVVPLFYRREGDTLHFAMRFTDLVRPDDAIRDDGLRAFLGLSSMRVVPLVEGVESVPPGAVLAFQPDGTIKTMYQYHLKPRKISQWTSKNALADEIDHLFTKALAKLPQSDEVGLYLSGGIDSGMIALGLQKLGVRVHAYTMGSWGAISSDLPYARRHAAMAGVATHQISLLESRDYQQSFNQLLDVYRDPIGLPAALAITKLWQDTDIGQQQQIFAGHLVDTLFSTLKSHMYATAFTWVPKALRRGFIPYDDPVHNYNYFISRHLMHNTPQFDTMVNQAPHLTVRQKVSFAGQVVAARGGEPINLPATNRGIIVSNPYYDMELVEFLLGIPTRHLLTLTRQSRILIAFNKRVFRHWAGRYLPADSVKHTKALMVSLDRDQQAKTFKASLPTSMNMLSFSHDYLRFAAAVYKRWHEQYHL